MKKYLLFFLVFFILNNSNAQTGIYHPFPDSNAVWCESNWYFDGQCPHYYQYAQFINGDTIIAGKTYHKLYRTGNEDAVLCGYYDTYQNSFSGLFRQDIANKKVYMYSFAFHTDTLLYDFNLSINDTVPETVNNYYGANYVSSIDSVLIDHKFRKRFWLSVVGSSSIEDSAYVALTEGVGSSMGLFALLLPPFESGGTLEAFNDSVNSNMSAVFCGITIGIQENLKIKLSQVFPNPFTNELTVIVTGNEHAQITIYDIASRKILQRSFSKALIVNTDQLEAGVYFYEIRCKSKFEKGKIVKE